MTAAVEAASAFVLFELGRTRLAVSAAHVRQLEMVESVTPVPNAPPSVDGVVAARGEMLPVVNLRVRLGMPRADLTLKSRLIVVQADGRTVALLVDSADEFVRIPSDKIEHPPEDVSGPFIAGVTVRDKQTILVLDVRRLLAASDKEAS